jgi:hypothetical protein
MTRSKTSWTESIILMWKAENTNLDDNSAVSSIIRIQQLFITCQE